MPKTPYQRPTGLDSIQVTRYLDSKVVAIRRTNQGLHRGLRTPEARCKLLLLDPRSGKTEMDDEARRVKPPVGWAVTGGSCHGQQLASEIQLLRMYLFVGYIASI